MKHKYTLGYQLAAFILFASLFLQSCDGSSPTNSPNIENTERVNPLEIIPTEIILEILSYLGIEDLARVKLVNKDLYELVAGVPYKKEDVELRGIENEPKLSYSINSEQGQYGLSLKQEIDFSKENLSQLTPETIPTLFFCRLIGKVKNLPEIFWPYINKTRIHTIDFSENPINHVEPVEFAQHLQDSQVHTINLSNNMLHNLKQTMVENFGEALQNTNVRKLILINNSIDGRDAMRLANSLHNTEVDTLDLRLNSIDHRGVVKFAQGLQGTKVHTVNLSGNQINFTSKDSEELKNFAEELKKTEIKTLILKGEENNISSEAQQYLTEKCPNIEWIF